MSNDPTPLTAEELAGMDEVYAKMTTGDWFMDGVFLKASPECDLVMCVYDSCDNPVELTIDDGSAIAALHNAYPRLRATIEAQAAEIDKWIADRDRWIDRFEKARADAAKELAEKDREIERLKSEGAAGREALELLREFSEYEPALGGDETRWNYIQVTLDDLQEIKRILSLTPPSGGKGAP